MYHGRNFNLAGTKGQQMNLWCCECCSYVDSMLVGGDVVYPHRPDLYEKKFYQCPNCKNSVGTHQQWGKSFVKGRDYNIRALGCIPNAKLKFARGKIHEILDPLWKGKRPGTRKRLYKRISRELGYEYHTGNTKTIEECRKVYRIIQKIYKEKDNK